MKKNNLLSQFQQRIDYQFVEKKLLKRALTHRSFGTPNNERLEFLGDSILGAIIGHYLFEAYPKAAEGQLTRLRSSLVRGDTLAEVARELEIGELLIMGEGELKSGGRDRDSLLADAVESIIGAVYLEAGFAVCQRFVLRCYQSRLAAIVIDKPLKDPKTELQEMLQAKGKALPEYTIIDTEGKSHNQLITVSCVIAGVSEPFVATAKNRKQAEKLAAASAITTLRDKS